MCFLGTTLASCGDIARILRCPSHVVPVVGFSLGYPAEEPQVRDRLPLRGLVHRDVYRHEADDEILETYRERETTGWERYMNVPELRALIESAEVDNLAQVYTRLKYTRESHERYSETVLGCLREQGFLRDV